MVAQDPEVAGLGDGLGPWLNGAGVVEVVGRQPIVEAGQEIVEVLGRVADAGELEDPERSWVCRPCALYTRTRKRKTICSRTAGRN